MNINSCEDLERAVQDTGILPFFKNNVKGFSIEEMTPDSLWFADDADGPWEWKGPVIREGNCAYGKLFRGKAGYVSLDLYPDFVNMRRANFKMSTKEKDIYQLIVDNDSLLSKEVKKLGGFRRCKTVKSDNPIDRLIKSPRCGRVKTEGFDTIMTRLQMHCYIVIADFEYQYTHDGKRYGWGIARYTTPEALFGVENIQCKRSPEESRDFIIQSVVEKRPDLAREQLLKLIEG